MQINLDKNGKVYSRIPFSSRGFWKIGKSFVLRLIRLSGFFVFACRTFSTVFAGAGISCRKGILTCCFPVFKLTYQLYYTAYSPSNFPFAFSFCFCSLPNTPSQSLAVSNPFSFPFAFCSFAPCKMRPPRKT